MCSTEKEAHTPVERTTMLFGEVRKPKLTEVESIKSLLDDAARDGRVLPRDLMELYTNVRDFHVYVDESGLGGCGALHVDMIDLAEVRSLVVREDLRGRGVGAQLLDALLGEAIGLDIGRVYALTREPDFFLRQGFELVSKDELPYKVFKDCMRCPLFPGCDEVAVMKRYKRCDETQRLLVETEQGQDE